MKDIKTLGDQLVNLTATEVRELAAYLKETYGIEQSVPMVAEFHPAGDGDYTPVKTLFDVRLINSGANKLQVVKLVKDVCGLGLKEAKELVDAAPKVIKEGLPKAEAENIKNQLLNIGAEVELK